MASASPLADGQHQLWLDVPRPIQPRPRRDSPRAERGAKSGFVASVAGQMELRMAAAPVAAAPVEAAPVEIAPPIRARPKAAYAEPVALAATPSFAAWLLDQGKQPGTLGELARAAKLDRLFPRTGTADDVRARFSAAGADGDAFEALDDAERVFDRL